MKKALLRTTVLLLITSIFLAAFAGIALADSIVATGGESYIRSTPSIYGKEVAMLPQGAYATYLGQSSVDNRGVTWYYISFNGKTGWVSSKYTSFYGSSGGSTSYGTVVATGGESNIRSTPSLYGTQIGLMPQGATATYLGESSVDYRGVKWYYISYNGKTGWVSSMYTTVYGGGSPSYGTVVATTGESYIRSTPSIYGTQITLLPNGGRATYLGQSSVDDRGVKWYYVSYNGKTGWVSSKYTSLY